MRALRESRAKVDEVLTHYVVQYQNSREAKEVRKNPVHDVVHISLTVLKCVILLDTDAFSGTDAPLPLLEIDARMRREEPMTRTCCRADAGCFKIGSIHSGGQHSAMVMAGRLLHSVS